jgi:hypothetical protein
MTTNAFTMRDPTAEAAPVQRERLQPPASLDGLTVALLDIGKTRSDEFLDHIDAKFRERGLKVKRYAKPTNTRVAPVEVLQNIATEADIVVEALAD